MPVLSPLFASAVETTASSDAFVNAAETAPLANGVPYLVLVTANTIATNSNSTTTETEATFGGTRHGLTRYRVGFSGAPNSGSGGQTPAVYVVTGDGTSTVAVRHRRTTGTGTYATTAHIACIPLDSLQEGAPGVLDQSLGDHWARSEGANSDTLTNPAAGSGWQTAGQHVDVTPNATGNFLILACLEGEFTAGHSASDLFRARCRVIEDPAGTPTEYNLGRNTIADPDLEGPESEVTGGSGWGNYALGQRWIDVLELTSGTTYRFQPQYEGVAGTANTGYRRARVFVLDLSVWTDVTVARDVDGQAGQDNTFATASKPAPSNTHDVLLLGGIAHANGNTWISSRFELDPDGTPSDLPATGGFGMALIDTGTAIGDDYAIMSLQWHRASVSVAEDYAINGFANLNNCRWGHVRGNFPGGVDDGVATPLIAWGMETSTAGGPATEDMAGSASGSATTSGDLDGTTDVDGSASGSASGSGSMGGTTDLGGAGSGSASTTGDLDVVAPGMGGSADGAASTSGSMSTTTDMSGAASAAAATSGTLDAGALLDGTASVAFIGNSYTQNYGGMPALLQWYVNQRISGASVTLGPPAYLATTISQYTDGYFAGMSLGGMTLFDDVDQSQVPTDVDSTDATDAVLDAAADAYDYVVLTSGFRQEARPGDAGVNDDAAVARVILPGAGGTGEQYDVCLEVMRRAIAELETGGSLANFAVRLTHEGFNANADADLSDMERTLRLQILACRQLESEGDVDLIVPEHYVWSRLLWGRFGSSLSGLEGPVPAYSSLTHQNSNQPGGANLAWLSRSQGTVNPFPRNGHQNAIGTIVAVWTWGYLLWGLDPRGDTTFQQPAANLPHPFDDMINPAGTRIYGGHNTGIGNNPYDTGTNPGGPPDSELDLDWSAATQTQIQDRIVAAVDDYLAGTTEFEPSGTEDLAGSASGSASGTASMGGTTGLAGSSSGSASGSAGLDSQSDLDGSADGSATGTGGQGGASDLAGSAAGAASGTGNLDDGSGGSSSGSSSGSGSMSSTTDLEGDATAAASGSGSLGGATGLGGSASGSSSGSGDLTDQGIEELEGVLEVVHAARSIWSVSHL